jgi:uncharacterized protein YdaU (DUF1376 family)
MNGSAVMQLTGMYWHIDRWRKSTAYTDLSLEEQGAYRNLLDEAWLRGGALPRDERAIAKACGDATRWKAVRGILLPRFEADADGLLHHATLDEVLAQSVRRSAKQHAYRQRLRGNGHR